MTTASKSSAAMVSVRTLNGRARYWLAYLLLATATTVTALDFTYEVNLDNTITITGYTGTGGPVVIPPVIDSKVVTILDENAFNGKIGITSVSIPDGVTSIGNDAFRGCTGLTSVVIPDCQVLISV